MASSSQHPTPTKEMGLVSVSSLLSPPEMKRGESFTSTDAINRTPVSSFESNVLPPISELVDRRVGRANPAGLPLSPPISPFSKAKDTIELVEERRSADPELYHGSHAGADFPLFPEEPSEQSQSESSVNDIIDKHIQENASKFGPHVTPPAREDYSLTIAFVSNVYEEAKRDPKGYYEKMMASNKIYRDARRNADKPKVVSTPLRRLAPAPAGVSKKIRIPAAVRTPRTPRAKKTPVMQALDSFDMGRASSPKPPRQPTNRDDVDYNSLKDYSPPVSTLPPGNKSLKADWKGAMLDLSADPDRHLLHEAELNLAATLRLSCATYLCSKRRIFLGRIDALKIGKEFRKTDAQQACKIDVNKASKLWSAYDRVGWFNPVFFRQYL